jgi:hypothetical protein
MPQIITPAQVVTMTKDGEVRVTITLELNINLNTSGEINTSVGIIDKPKSKFDEVDWDLPELSSGRKVEFGKGV